MKTVYALIFACLSLQACIGQSETPTATNINEYSSANEFATTVPTGDDHTAAVTAPAIEEQPIENYAVDGDFYVDDDYNAAVTLPPAKPLEDYSFDAYVDFNVDDDTTGLINAPAAMPLNDHSVDTTVDRYAGGESTASVTPSTTPKAEDAGIDFYADDDSWDFQLPAAIDPSIEASDWY
jgi:hypothetical protein